MVDSSAVIAEVGYLVRDNQVMLRIDRASGSVSEICLSGAAGNAPKVSPQSRIVASTKAQDAGKAPSAAMPARGRCCKVGVRRITSIAAAPEDEAVRRFRECKHSRPKFGSS